MSGPVTLTSNQVNDVLVDVTYRDGWGFTALATEEGVMVRLIASVIHAGTGQPLDLGIDTYLSPNDLESEAALLRWLQWRLQRIEHHEAREFLKYQGRPISPPDH